MRLRPLPPVSVLSFLFAVYPASANDVWDQEFYKLHNDRALTVACGIGSHRAEAGFERRLAELKASGSRSEEQRRKIRIKAWLDIDLEFNNRGLGGYRPWCEKDGRAALSRMEALAE